MKVHVLGIDLAKNVFQLHGVDHKGRATLMRRVHREQLVRIIGELPPCLIGIEASTGAFYWATTVREARPYRKDYRTTVRKAVRTPAEERFQRR